MESYYWILSFVQDLGSTIGDKPLLGTINCFGSITSSSVRDYSIQWRNLLILKRFVRGYQGTIICWHIATQRLCNHKMGVGSLNPCFRGVPSIIVSCCWMNASDDMHKDITPTHKTYDRWHIHLILLYARFNVTVATISSSLQLYVLTLCSTKWHKYIVQMLNSDKACPVMNNCDNVSSLLNATGSVWKGYFSVQKIDIQLFKYFDIHKPFA